MVPKRIFFTKGVGKHRERLTSFELALRDAGIAAQNLVRVSSIFPPQCKLIARSQGLDRKSTRLNSSHLVISYAVFCLKKKKKNLIDHSEHTSSHSPSLPVLKTRHRAS